MFLHNDKLYQREDSFAIGYPSAPTMANFLLEHIETIMLKKQTSDYPKICVRYTGDIFVVCSNNNACMPFLKVLNDQHFIYN